MKHVFLRFVSFERYVNSVNVLYKKCNSHSYLSEIDHTHLLVCVSAERRKCRNSSERLWIAEKHPYFIFHLDKYLNTLTDDINQDV